MKELLLCLRPIRDGDSKVGSNLKFVPAVKNEKECVTPDGASYHKVEIIKTGPMKKRPLPDSGQKRSNKKSAMEKSGSEAEKSVVESLILMSSHSRQTS